MREGLRAVGERALGLLPAAWRAPLVRFALRLGPHSVRLSIAGSALPLLRADDWLPVLAGPLAGARWIAASALQSCLEGSYELENQQLLVEWLQPGAVVFDVGANVGFFTLLAARLVGSGGRVIAFEPVPQALASLRRHLELNHLDNVTVIPAAVSAEAGQAHFQQHTDLTMGRLGDQGELEVELVSLDGLLDELPKPSLLKIDVEGEEVNVLRGASRLLREQRPMLLLATHGSAVHEQCCGLLREAGYELEPLPYELETPEFDFLGELAATPSAR